MLDRLKLQSYEFDFIVVMSSRYLLEIYDEIRAQGVPDEKILDGGALMMPGFRIGQYAKKRSWEFPYREPAAFQDLSSTIYDHVLVGEHMRLAIGRRTYIGEIRLVRGIADDQVNLAIGRYCSISANIDLQFAISGNHDYHRVTSMPWPAFPKTARICIGNDVWIGRDAVLKTKRDDSLYVGDGAVIASDSVVVKDVPPYAIVGGNPARIIKYRFDDATREKLLAVKWWDWPWERVMCARSDMEDVSRFLEKYGREIFRAK